jgi:hypothetical protein
MMMNGKNNVESQLVFRFRESKPSDFRSKLGLSSGGNFSLFDHASQTLARSHHRTKVDPTMLSLTNSLPLGCILCPFNLNKIQISERIRRQ